MDIVSTQIEEIFAINNSDRLLNKEILYSNTYGNLPRYIFWSKVVDISPNREYVKLLSLDDGDATPYFLKISNMEILDILNPDNFKEEI